MSKMVYVVLRQEPDQGDISVEVIALSEGARAKAILESMRKDLEHLRTLTVSKVELDALHLLLSAANSDMYVLVKAWHHFTGYLYTTEMHELKE